MKNNEHISHLFATCDEVFNKQRVVIPVVIQDSDGSVLFPNFPSEGWNVAVYSLGDCFETHLYRQGDVSTYKVRTIGTTPQELETHLKEIHYRYFEEGETTLATPNATPNATATLTIDDNTPTSILRDLAARALGWEDRPYDSVEQGRLWHCEAQNAPFGPSIPKTLWKPDQNSDQTLALIANLGINITVNHDEEEIKSRVMIEAAKIGARKLGENS